MINARQIGEINFIMVKPGAVYMSQWSGSSLVMVMA